MTAYRLADGSLHVPAQQVGNVTIPELRYGALPADYCPSCHRPARRDLRGLCRCGYDLAARAAARTERERAMPGTETESCRLTRLHNLGE